MTRLLLPALALLAACTAPIDPGADLPPFAGQPFPVGVLVCPSGPTGSKAPDLERTALLAEELINGSNRAYPGLSPEQIPCRVAGTCGVRTAAGERAPLRLIIANTNERDADAVTAARRLVEEHQVAAVIGPCSSSEMGRVFQEVTRTELPLISPTVSEDAISGLDDRTAIDRAEDRPGYVYRTVTPDYIQLLSLGYLGMNVITGSPLLHVEDFTEQSCSSDDVCKSLGADHACRVPNRSATPGKTYLNVTRNRCDGEAADYCNRFGRTYDCIPAEGGQFCAQYTFQRYCARVPRPKSAIILYPDTLFGKEAQARVQGFWSSRPGNQVLAAAGYAPATPSSFSSVLESLFILAGARFDSLKSDGSLPTEARFEDTVVFLLGEATEGALLLKEWSAIAANLPVEGAGGVFWLGTDRLRSRLLTDQLKHHELRNLFVTDPSVVDINNQAFFEELFQARWGFSPRDYSGQIFDAVALVALAQERAEVRQNEGSTVRERLKNSLALVGAGCLRPDPVRGCEAAGPKLIFASRLHEGIAALGQGLEIRFQGVTGNLTFSSAGDRMSELDIWKIGLLESGSEFFLLQKYIPESNSIGLER
jgi:ABC-type branched-subunit amino acid transport system substrate-binding protein